MAAAAANPSMTQPIVGPLGRLYADPKPSPDAQSFQVNNTSAQYYRSPYYLAHQKQLQPIPSPRNTQPLDLRDFLPEDVISAIEAAGKISFHAVGDTGAAKVGANQSAATSLAHQELVADFMAQDVAGVDAGSAPAFFYHLGDVIYNFGEAQYYYDQFYEPYREYDRPIFAIPGNHDAMVWGPSSSAPSVPTLSAFLQNFCAPAPGASPDAGTLVRSVMTQPGVYFALDAPFVSIIGLYSNCLDSGPGVISSQKGKYPISDEQLGFLTAQLTRLKDDRTTHLRPIVLAVHHPPLSADSRHGGSTGLSDDIDACCQAAGVWPDIVLSGHAHLYQRFARTLPTGRTIPYVVAGCGGFAATRPPGKIPPAGTTYGEVTLVVDPIVEFGYMTLEVDANQSTLTGTYWKTDNKTQSRTVGDHFTIDLKTGKVS